MRTTCRSVHTSRAWGSTPSAASTPSCPPPPPPPGHPCSAWRPCRRRSGLSTRRACCVRARRDQATGRTSAVEPCCSPEPGQTQEKTGAESPPEEPEDGLADLVTPIPQVGRHRSIFTQALKASVCTCIMYVCKCMHVGSGTVLRSPTARGLYIATKTIKTDTHLSTCTCRLLFSFTSTVVSLFQR